jgi:hypothetical protein
MLAPSGKRGGAGCPPHLRHLSISRALRGCLGVFKHLRHLSISRALRGCLGAFKHLLSFSFSRALRGCPGAIEHSLPFRVGTLNWMHACWPSSLRQRDCKRFSWALGEKLPSVTPNCIGCFYGLQMFDLRLFFWTSFQVDEIQYYVSQKLYSLRPTKTVVVGPGAQTNALVQRVKRPCSLGERSGISNGWTRVRHVGVQGCRPLLRVGPTS